MPHVVRVSPSTTHLPFITVKLHIHLTYALYISFDPGISRSMLRLSYRALDLLLTPTGLRQTNTTLRSLGFTIIHFIGAISLEDTLRMKCHLLP